MELKKKVSIKESKILDRSFVKDPTEKIALSRLRILKLAEELKNVSAACRQGSMDRSSFYEWRRRFQTHGMDGLRDLPPVRKTHPNRTPEPVERAVVDLSKEHPAWGCKRLASEMGRLGMPSNHFTIQAILKREGMGTMRERLLKLEESALEGAELSPELLKAVERLNPCFKERHVESSCPGELVCFDSFFVGTLKGVGKVWLFTAVDTHGSYAFGSLATSRTALKAAELLHGHVLPFYEAHGLSLGAALTDNGTEFCGTEEHIFERVLFESGAEHRRTRVKRPQTNGFVERFHRTILDEFFRVEFRKRVYEDLDALEASVQEWICYYNAERPHQGYRNRGRTPYETVLMFVKA